MFQSAVCWGMWSYLTWTSPGVPRRRSVWAPPPSPALGTKLSHKHNHTLATPGLQLCASHRREMGKTLHQGDRINLITNRLAKAGLTPAVPGERRTTQQIYTITYWNSAISSWSETCFPPDLILVSPHLTSCLSVVYYKLVEAWITFFKKKTKQTNKQKKQIDLDSGNFIQFLCIYFISISCHDLSKSFKTWRFKGRLPLVTWYANDP